MIDAMTKVRELERELYVRTDLTEREKLMLEAIQYMLANVFVLGGRDT